MLEEVTRYDRFKNFRSQNSKPVYDGKTEPVKVKIRGGTKFHWVIKRSPIQWISIVMRSSQVILHSRKRAIFGEALLHEIANELIYGVTVKLRAIKDQWPRSRNIFCAPDL